MLDDELLAQQRYHLQPDAEMAGTEHGLPRLVHDQNAVDVDPIEQADADTPDADLCTQFGAEHVGYVSPQLPLDGRKAQEQQGTEVYGPCCDK